MNEGLMSFKTQSFMYLLIQTTAPASFCPKKTARTSSTEN